MNPYLKRLNRTKEERYKRERDASNILAIIEALRVELINCDIILKGIGKRGESTWHVFQIGTFITRYPYISLHDNPVHIIEYMEEIEKIIDDFYKSGRLDVHMMMEML